MLDNVEIAILTKVNDLAYRFQIKAYEFCASVYEDGDDPSRTTLRFNIPVSGNAVQEERFCRMLNQIGFDAQSHSLTGTDKQIIDALDAAQARAPRLKHF